MGGEASLKRFGYGVVVVVATTTGFGCTSDHGGASAPLVVGQARSAVVTVASETVGPRTASTSTLPSYLGNGAIAISGNTALIGSTTDSQPGPVTGAAHAYVHSGTAWSEQQKILPPASIGDSAFFGNAVAIDGDTAVIGAHYSGATRQGSAWVSTRTGTTWSAPVEIVQPDARDNEWFGDAVAVSGDWLVVTTNGPQITNDPLDDSNGHGAAYLYFRQGSTWTFEQKLLSSVADGVLSRSTFGLALQGDTLALGDLNLNLVDVFTRTGTTWTVSQSIADDGGGEFGNAIALDGDVLAIGAMTANSVFVYRRTGGAFTLGQTIVPTATGQSFGNTLALSGDVLLVGETFYDVNTSSVEGRAHYFARGASGFVGDTVLIGSDTDTRTYFGGVGIAGDHALFATRVLNPVANVDPYQVVGFSFAFSNGDACTENASCGSGYCVSGVCCATACNGACQACSAATKQSGADGVCGTASTGTVCAASSCASNTSEIAPSACNAAGACIAPAATACPSGVSCVDGACQHGLGSACTIAGDCQSGYCADGVCCDSACGGDQSGDCLVCSKAHGATADGTCTPRADDTVCDDQSACTTGDTCRSGACVGTSAPACTALDECHVAGCCAPAIGVCSDPAKPDGTPCSVGACVAGTCGSPIQRPDQSFSEVANALNGTPIVAMDGDFAATSRESAGYTFHHEATGWVRTSGFAASATAHTTLGISSAGLLLGSYQFSDEEVASLTPYTAYPNWAPGDQLVPSGDSYLFGSQIVMDGDRALLEADQNCCELGGLNESARVLLHGTGATWTEEATLLDRTDADHGIQGFALSGDTAAVGTTDGVYVFLRDSSSGWGPDGLVTQPGGSNTWDLHHLAVSSDTLVVGSYSDHDRGTDSGAAYVFVRAGASDWELQQKLTSFREKAGDQIGLGVGLAGDIVLVAGKTIDGGPLDVVQFVRTGTTWTETRTLEPDQPNDLYGLSFGIAGNQALIATRQGDYFFTLSTAPLTTPGAGDGGVETSHCGESTDGGASRDAGSGGASGAGGTTSGSSGGATNGSSGGATNGSSGGATGTGGSSGADTGGASSSTGDGATGGVVGTGGASNGGSAATGGSNAATGGSNATSSGGRNAGDASVNGDASVTTTPRGGSSGSGCSVALERAPRPGTSPLFLAVAALGWLRRKRRR